MDVLRRFSVSFPADGSSLNRPIAQRPTAAASGFAAASLMAVLGLWALFDPVLGVLSVRADAGLALTQALILGAAIKIIPDYLSLYETRRLLKTFEKGRHPLKQLAVLALDAVVTGAIIFIGIRIYLWASGQPALSLVEMAALFSFYAVFFLFDLPDQRLGLGLLPVVMDRARLAPPEAA